MKSHPEYGVLLTALWITLTTASMKTPEGIHFRFEKKILLAESYTKIKILVPFPKEPASSNSSMRDVSKRIEQIWTTPTVACELNGTDPGRNVTSSVKWMEKVINQEMEKMRGELTTLATDLGELLNIHSVQTTEPQNFRRRRLAATAVAVGAASVFGGGIAVGSSIVCALKGIFGSCNGQSKKNTKAIKELTRTTNYFRDDLWEVHSIQNRTYEKFFLIASELKELEEARIRLEATQEKQWETSQTQLKIMEHNIHMGRKCDQFLFTKVQAEHYIGGINVALTTLHANTKTFRTAL